MLKMGPWTGRESHVLDNSIQTHPTASQRILLEWSLTQKSSAAVGVCRVPAEFVLRKPHSFSSRECVLGGLGVNTHSVATSER